MGDGFWWNQNWLFQLTALRNNIKIDRKLQNLRLSRFRSKLFEHKNIFPKKKWFNVFHNILIKLKLARNVFFKIWFDFRVHLPHIHVRQSTYNATHTYIVYIFRRKMIVLAFFNGDSMLNDLKRFKVRATHSRPQI